MVFAINAVDDSSENFVAFQTRAMGGNGAGSSVSATAASTDYLKWPCCCDYIQCRYLDFLKCPYLERLKCRWLNDRERPVDIL
jgi:hypothetical protein